MPCMRPLPGLTPTSLPLAEFLSANVHAFSRDDLLQHWTRRALENALHAGHAVRLLPGVYAASNNSAVPRVRGEALNLWHPAGLVTGPLALHMYAARLPAPPMAHMRVEKGTRPRAPGWVVCVQGQALMTSSSPRGVDCTVPAVALLDAWRFANPSARRDVLWEALWARVCTWRQLKGELDRASRVAGRRELEQVLGWFSEGATTPLEVRAKHEVFTGPRFREFERQVPLHLPTRRAVPDMLHRRAMVAVELEGDRFHSTREARDRDRERRNDLVAAGYAVVEFGWKDIATRPEWCRERVLTVVAGRLGRPGGTSRPVLGRI